MVIMMWKSLNQAVKVKISKEDKQNLKEIKATHKLKSLASFANNPIFITTPSSILT